MKAFNYGFPTWNALTWDEFNSGDFYINSSPVHILENGRGVFHDTNHEAENYWHDEVSEPENLRIYGYLNELRESCKRRGDGGSSLQKHSRSGN